MSDALTPEVEAFEALNKNYHHPQTKVEKLE
jgi:hypothetical protein